MARASFCRCAWHERRGRAEIAPDLRIEPCNPVSPWLAGLYVAPEHRCQGVGRALVRAIEDQARRRHYCRLYLYTDNEISYYEQLGWRVIDRIDWKGFPTALMVAATGGDKDVS